MLLLMFVETLFEMLVAQRAAIRSLSRRATMQTHALARLNYRLRHLERKIERSTTVQ